MVYGLNAKAMPEVSEFRSAQATGRDWSSALSACLAQLDGDADRANLGFVYVADPFSEAFDQIVGTLAATTGVANWVGTTATGVIATGQEYADGAAIVVLLGHFPEGGFALFDGTGDASGVGERVWTDGQAAFGVVHGDARQAGVVDQLRDLAERSGAFLVGGLTSSRVSPLQVSGGMTAGAVSGVLFSERIPVVTAVSQGCTPIGKMHEVTSCYRNIVLALDGRPAIDVLKEEIGDLLARNLDRAAGYIHVALPVRGSDRADYVVRNLLGVDAERGALAIGEMVGQGDPLMLVRRDGESANEDLRRMLDDLANRSSGRAIRAALYYSCVARGPHMFGPGSVEARMIRDTFGSVPLVGFFCDGEIFNERLYGYTGVLSLLL
jgi:small ligand-binding sensory domain FIST